MAKEKFGAVDCGLWRNKNFKLLDDNSKLLFLYLKTCDHQNMIGCFHLPIGYMSADIKWSENKIKETLSKLLERGFASYCEGSEYVFLPKHLHKHPLQSPNQGKGAESLFDQVPKDFIYIKDLCNVLISQQALCKPFASRLETLCNSVSVSVSVSETVSVTEAVTPIKKTEKEKQLPPDFETVSNLNMPAWTKWLKYRKNVLNAKNYKTLLKAKKLSQFPYDIQAKAVDIAMEKEWSDVYPEKIGAGQRAKNVRAMSDQELRNLCDKLKINMGNKNYEQIYAEIDEKQNGN